MKAIIWIIVIALVAWALYYFMMRDSGTDLIDNTPAAQSSDEANYDLGEFQDKG